MVNFNKRGQFFSLYLVLLTLLMCGVVIATYLLQQDGLENSLVSPRGVMELRDNLDTFEMREMNLMQESLNSAKGTFPEEDFIDSFRDNFISGFMADESLKGFILAGLVHDGVSFEAEARANLENFLDGGLYTRSLTYEDGGELVFTRARVQKATLLNPQDKTKINFPIDLYFDFGRKYIISFKGGEFEIR